MAIMASTDESATTALVDNSHSTGSGGGDDNDNGQESPHLSDQDRIRQLEEELIKMKLELAMSKNSEDFLKLELVNTRAELEQAQRENADLRGRIIGDRSNPNDASGRGIDGLSHFDVDDEDASAAALVETAGSTRPTDIRRRPPSCASGIALLTGATNPSDVSLGSLVDLLDRNNNGRRRQQEESDPNPLVRPPRGMASCASGIALLTGAATEGFSSSSMSSFSSFLGRESLTRIAEGDGAAEGGRAATQARPRARGRSRGETRSSSNYQGNEEWDVQPPRDDNVFQKFL